MSTRTALIDAFLAGDPDTAVGLLADDAAFHSPVRTYRGAERIRPLWTLLDGIIEDLRPGSLLENDCETAAFFEGSVAGRPIDGVLKVRGQLGAPADEVTLMLRPYGAMKAAVAEMARRLEAAA